MLPHSIEAESHSWEDACLLHFHTLHVKLGQLPRRIHIFRPLLEAAAMLIPEPQTRSLLLKAAAMLCE